MAGETPALVRLSGVSVCLQPSDYIRRGRICEWLVFSFFLQTPPRYPMGKSQISFLSWGDPASPLGLDGRGEM